MGRTSHDAEPRGDPPHRRRYRRHGVAARGTAGPRRQPARRRRHLHGLGRPRRRAAGRVLLDHQPPQRGAHRRRAGWRSTTRRWTAPSWSSAGPARTVPMHQVRRGDRVVVGGMGVRVHATAPGAERERLRVHGVRCVVGEAQGAAWSAKVADRIRRAKEAGGRLLVVCGPAVVHTGGSRSTRSTDPQRLGRRALRRQRLRHPRHRDERPRHQPRRVGGRTAARPRAVTATTSGSSTRFVATDRSPTRSPPGTCAAG